LGNLRQSQTIKSSQQSKNFIKRTLTIMKNKLTLALISIAMLFTGCASTTRASADMDKVAKVFKPAMAKSSLFIFRNEYFGAAIGMPLKINGQDIGETGPKSFYRLDLDAGLYVITSEAETKTELPVVLVNGKNHFVWQEVRMGVVTVRSALRLVDEKTGMGGVLESDLLVSKVSSEALSKTAIIRK